MDVHVEDSLGAEIRHTARPPPGHLQIGLRPICIAYYDNAFEIGNRCGHFEVNLVVPNGIKGCVCEKVECE
jgi:hypothetical protein